MQLVANFANTNFKMSETLANGYSSKSSQKELSNEFLHDRVKMFFNFLRSCALDESSLGIGRVNYLFVVTMGSCGVCKR